MMTVHYKLHTVQDASSRMATTPGAGMRSAASLPVCSLVARWHQLAQAGVVRLFPQSFLCYLDCSAACLMAPHEEIKMSP